MPRSSKQVALITGGARGIGLGISRVLAATGWDLMLNGVRPADDVTGPLEELRSHGHAVDYHAADISSAEDRAGLVSAMLERFGRVDALINNAGIASPGRVDILQAEEDAFDRVLDVNLKGPYFLTQLVARQMVRQRGESDAFRGVIVFVSSVSAQFASINRGDYCISKAALGMVSQLWAARLAEYHIDVYEVRPGVIHTDMTAGVSEKYDALIDNGLTLARRWGEPEDIGKAVGALVQGAIPYATGQVLNIDGGMSIRTL